MSAVAVQSPRVYLVVIARGGTLVAADLVLTGLALALLMALFAAAYSVYHHWRGRGRLTADTLYHRQRARLGVVGFLLSGLVLFVLVLLLGVGR